jgi:hypothetical protein
MGKPEGKRRRGNGGVDGRIILKQIARKSVGRSGISGWLF